VIAKILNIHDFHLWLIWLLKILA